jgi:2-isopropylmalate synthase
MSASVSIDIFDTTLRDGDQGHQTPFLPHEKIHIAHLLADARVDVIEAGFGASRTDSSVREVARSV